MLILTPDRDFQLGMGIISSKQADFAGISETPGLYVDQVIQKAFIEVNEQGTEATAATAGKTHSWQYFLFPSKFKIKISGLENLSMLKHGEINDNEAFVLHVIMYIHTYI